MTVPWIWEIKDSKMAQESLAELGYCGAGSRVEGCHVVDVLDVLPLMLVR